MSIIYASIITGLFGFLTALVSIWLTKRNIHKEKETISNDLKLAVSGHWEGTVFQDEGFDENPMEYPVMVNLKANKKLIQGSGFVKAKIDGKEIKADLKLEGGFYIGRLLKIDYINRDPAYLHFGSFLLELDPVPSTMKGRFSGYGAYTKKLVGGKISLKKT